jgi:hypothetical protein
MFRLARGLQPELEFCSGVLSDLQPIFSKYPVAAVARANLGGMEPVLSRFQPPRDRLVLL